MTLFNLQARQRHLARARPHFADHGFLIDHVWTNLNERMLDIKRYFDRTAVLGWRGAEHGLTPMIERGQINPNALTILEAMPTNEILPLVPQETDLVLSVFDLHVVNDPALLMAQLRHALAPQGAALLALPGGQTLHALHTALIHADQHHHNAAAPRVHPCLTAPILASLMQQAQFKIPVIDQETIHVSYPNLMRLLQDLKGMGEGSCLASTSRPLNRAIIDTAEDFYRHHHADHAGLLDVQFDIVWAIGWAD
jgi:SAM-dependent methyltransferase